MRTQGKRAVSLLCVLALAASLLAAPAAARPAMTGAAVSEVPAEVPAGVMEADPGAETPRSSGLRAAVWVPAEELGQAMLLAEVKEADYLHNFTTAGKSSTFYTVSGNLSTGKGTVSYNKLTLTQCLKMESATTVTFNAPADGTLTLVFEAAGTVKVDGDSKTVSASGDNFLWSGPVSAGDHTIAKGSGINLFYMAYARAQAAAHDYQEGLGKVTREPTCSVKGELTYTCTVAGCSDPTHKRTEEIATVAHKYQGSSVYCVMCGQNKNNPSDVHTAHSWGAGEDGQGWVTTTPASCAASGVKTRTCSVCGKTETGTIPQGEHHYENGACTICGAPQAGAVVGGWFESLYAEMAGVAPGEVTGVSWSGASNGSLSKEDLTYLVRTLTKDNSSTVTRIDVPGVKPGAYTLTIQMKTGSYVASGVQVMAYDRSGFAHYKYTSGVGAYKDDGTLKSNAIVLYVTNENKNSVKLTVGSTTVTGIGNILNSAGQEKSGGKTSEGGKANSNKGIIKKLSQAGTPLVVRIVGRVKGWSGDNAGAVSEINGLTANDSLDYGGSLKDNGFMARIKSGKDITIEGIGPDAVVDGWGFHFMSEGSSPSYGKSFELRNIKFENAPEDCVGMEGVQSGSTVTAPVERCWIHNCEFYVPNIPYAVESDKHEGDGACDFKRGNYMTMSYCYYEGYHKTNLIGASDSNLQFHITWHHNYYKNCMSRGPLARQANIHIYNTVYDGQTSYCQNPRANSYIFSEYNLFTGNTKAPGTVTSGGVIKSYNDWFEKVRGDQQATVVTSKTKTVSSANTYANFDTNSSLSYIPSGDYLLDTTKAAMLERIEAYTGVMKPAGSVSVPDTPIPAPCSHSYAWSQTKAPTCTAGGVETGVCAKCGDTQTRTVAALGHSFGGWVITVDPTCQPGEEERTCTVCNAKETHAVAATGEHSFGPDGKCIYGCGNTNSTDGSGEHTFDATKLPACPEQDSVVVTDTEMAAQGNGVFSAWTDGAEGKVVKRAKKPQDENNSVPAGDVNWSTASVEVSQSESAAICFTVFGTADVTIHFSSTGGENWSSLGVMNKDGALMGYDSLTAAAAKSAVKDFNSDKKIALVQNTGAATITYKGLTTGSYKIVNASVGGALVPGTTANGTKNNPDKRATRIYDITVDDTGSGGSGGGGEAPAAGSYVHNFTTDGKESNFYSITGNLATGKGTSSYLGLALTQALKMESATTVTFSSSAPGTLTLVFGDAETGATVLVDGTKYTATASVVTVSLELGEHTVKKSGTANLFYMVFAPSGSGGESGGGGGGGEEHTCSDFKTVNQKDPNCTETGYTGDVVCTECGKVKEKGSVIPALGHTWSGEECSVCHVKKPTAGAGKFTKTGGWFETAYAQWNYMAGVTSYNVYCKKTSASSWGTKVDDQLIRQYPSYMRVDIPGLAAGEYTIKVVPCSGGAELSASAMETGPLTVRANDRSGFAWSAGGSPGAYKMDGTLKDNAQVIYLTEENKDTVTLAVNTDGKGMTDCVGIQNIILGFKKRKDNRPLCVRVIGNITDPAVLSKGDLYIDGAGNGITIEGIGTDATINGFGIVLKSATNVEVRNLGFMNCDSSEGDSLGLQQANDHVWTHNNDFFYGHAGSDKDQVKGDGSLDTKKSTYVTHSYNHFWDSGKTHLQGMKDEVPENYITYHHNWYDHSDSRHPRVRTCTVHVYNNYFDGNAKYGVGATLAANIFVEKNYFRSTSTLKPMMISMQGTDIAAGAGTFSGENGGMIKAYDNIMAGKSVKYAPYSSANPVEFDAYEAKSRNEQVPSSVKTKQGGTPYSNFDTDSSLMYAYTPDEPGSVPAEVEAWAGRMEGGDLQWTFTDADDGEYLVIDGLKAKLTGYKTTLVKVGSAVDATAGAAPAQCAHKNTRWVTTLAASCATEGSKSQVCADCGETVATESIPATGHSLRWVVTESPTCTGAGTETSTCSVCAKTFGDRSVPAAGHKFEDGVCTECGEADPGGGSTPPPGPTVTEKTYVLRAKEDVYDQLTSNAQDKNKKPIYECPDTNAWGELGTDKFFSVYYTEFATQGTVSTGSRVDYSSKTFDDGYASDYRLNLGGPAGVQSNAVSFTTEGKATVSVWWVQGGADGDREIVILDDAGKEAAATMGDGYVKNNPYYSTLILDAPGTYYLGSTPANNYLFKVQVVDAISSETPVTVDRTGLTAAIAAAQTEKGKVVVCDEDGADVPPEQKWVTQDAMDELVGAIAVAETVLGDSTATQAQINTAVTALNAAVTTFQNAQSNGNLQPETPPEVDDGHYVLDSFSSAIDDLHWTCLEGVLTLTDPEKLPTGHTLVAAWWTPAGFADLAVLSASKSTLRLPSDWTEVKLIWIDAHMTPQSPAGWTEKK